MKKKKQRRKKEEVGQKRKHMKEEEENPLQVQNRMRPKQLDRSSITFLFVMEIESDCNNNKKRAFDIK